ncbi:hypothetical protein [Vitiosangium sp. GDMCC 1.1324]|uniref:hypothetical protein n=1 Tax=Vitiosangium sp. (strain GDMCC 1.1324) TaxID=2138576 RepID=UPI000D365311|nr:hypothetical protein [Vitiosangium sp. GDMCC 1.1324]PTL85833.1 hypothetical protein DAT35_03825 [Vitiosangium sp. GDMCC 1.1324]
MRSTRAAFFRRVAWTTLVCVATSLPAAARDPDDLPGITYPTAPVVRKKAPEMQRKLQGVLEGLQHTPQLADPRGVSVHSGLSLVPEPDLRVTKAEATVLLKPIFKDSKETHVDKKTGRYQGVGEGNTIEIKVNDLERLRIDPSNPDAILYEPPQVGSLQGFPLYQVGSATPILLLTAKDRQLWRRLTAKEYLERVIREGGPDGEAAKRQLAQGGNLDRPACVPVKRGESVGSCDGTNATYLVTWNPGYFNAKKPDAIQLVTIRIGAASHTKPTENYFKQHPLDPLTQAVKAYEQYDWSQLAKLIE